MRIAAFQRFPVFDDPAGAADAVVRDVKLANERGVDLALFPKCYLQGHDYDRF